MKKINLTLPAILIGMLCVFVGAQMLVVEDFTLSPEATRFLARWTIDKSENAQAAVTRFVTDNTPVRHTISPQRWVCWTFLCVGGVLVGYGLLARYRK